MNIFRKSQKGFTLIELLVVIAIIGILSSVVLASLNTARTRAREAAFKSEVRGALPALVIACEDGATAMDTAATNVAAGTPTISSIALTGTASDGTTALSNNCPSDFIGEAVATSNETGSCTGAIINLSGVVDFLGCN